MNQILLKQISTEYGTPLYVYNLDKVKEQYSKLAAHIAWPKVSIHYAMKANFNLDILKTLCSLGSSIDAVSIGEILLAKYAGFRSEQILFTTNNMTDSEMQRAYQEEVLFVIDSVSRLESFAKNFPKSKVALRFNTEIAIGENAKVITAGDLTKFGISLSDVPLILDIARKYQLKIIGLHKHSGSGIYQIAPFLEATEKLYELALTGNFPDLEFLDFGGGFKVSYKTRDPLFDYQLFGKAISEKHKSFCKNYGKDLELKFEPGKFLVAESGYFLIEVNTIKNNNGRIIAGTNSGFTHLIRPVLYDAYHEVSNLSNPQGNLIQYDVVGNICETGDYFAFERDLPEIRVGDLLAVHNAGAYCYSMASVYNLRALPAEVVIENGEHKLSRKALKSEELIQSIVKDYE